MINTNPKSSYLSLKKLSVDDRPREKLIKNGSPLLSNAEILGILIGSGTTEKSAVQLCRDILTSVNNDLDKLALLSIPELTKFKGIGPAKAVTLSAAFELGRRRHYVQREEQPIIRSSSDIYRLINSRFKDLEHEEFYIILLNRGNKVKSVDLISKGGISGTAVDGKVIFKKALQHTASAVILCHNHPSGNLKPSRSDIEITKKLKGFGQFIDLPVLDHLIITDTSYFSFADNDMM